MTKRTSLLFLAFFGHLIASCGDHSADDSTSDLTDSTIERQIAIAAVPLSASATDARAHFIAGADRSIHSVFVCVHAGGNQCVAGTESYLRAMTAPNHARALFQTRTELRVSTQSVYIFVAYDLASQVVHKRLVRFHAIGSPTTAVQGRWKAVLMTGDNSIDAFDNARRKIAELITKRGIAPEDIRQLSMNRGPADVGVEQASLQNFESALTSLQPGPDDGCFVFMTSHGSRSGFYMVNQGEISPQEFSGILDRVCGNRPTVALVSACYSGIMISPEIQRPNRVVLTAARRDQTSFGCSPKNEYTYWDECLIKNLPTAQNWNSVHADIYRCIEIQEGGRTSSDPQSFIGANMQQAGIFSAAIGQTPSLTN